ncbi:MAG TPA: hypothetical protein VH593_21030 [Ktedonobacteraceae bacterium]
MQEQQQPVQEKRWRDYLDYEFSRFVAHVTGAEPNTCFDNVLSLFMTFSSYVLASGGKMVEGWYVIDLEDEVVTNEHAWYEFPDGKILDPTTVLLVPREQPVYYFPGVHRSWQEVHDILHQEGDTYFPYVRCVGIYGEDGLGHPVYKAAYEAAREKVFSLSMTNSPPKRMTFLTAQDLEHDQQGMGISIHVFPDLSASEQEAQDRPESHQKEKGS